MGGTQVITIHRYVAFCDPLLWILHNEFWLTRHLSQINTLYVGNLPSAPSPGGSPPVILEERLRELFSKRPGYRKLCFRQKSNGPMCFVEVRFMRLVGRRDPYHTINSLVRGRCIRYASLAGVAG